MSSTSTQTTTEKPSAPLVFGNFKDQGTTGAKGYNKEAEESGENPAKYPHYLPEWKDEKYPPLEPFDYIERGANADPSFPEILGSGVTRADLTPTIGTEIKGVQLSQLSEAGKSELALLTAQRKVLIFREQDFADLPIDDALEYCRFFGRLHIHITSGAPKGHPEVHLIHRGAGNTQGASLLENRLSTVTWHSDVTFEEQPPGTTFMYIFETPSTGGDTPYVDMVEAYRRLSPLMRERLHGLTAVHSAFEQSNAAKARDSIVRREPVANAHPVVRTHPATVTRYIVGMKKEESDALLNMLYSHMSLGADFQVRPRWEKRSVVVWDNRVTAHTALLDWVNGQRRHLARITPQAERPYETPYDREQEEKEDKARIAGLGTPILNM